MVEPKKVDLQTRWLGFGLRSPIVLGASPLTDDIGALQAAVAAGASAIVMRSLFEEQIVAEQMAVHRYVDSHVDLDAEARTFLPGNDVFPVGADPYVAQLKKIKMAVRVPVLASLNGVTPGGWLDAARRVADAGADAIELNLYDVVIDPAQSSGDVEARQLEVVARVASSVSVPVSVKISPFYASLPSFAARLGSAGAKGLVLFNRFYQTDIDVDALDVRSTLSYSSPADLPLRLHGLAVLSGRSVLDLAASGGVHSGLDAMKAILAGATVVQMTSAALQRGPGVFEVVTRELREKLAHVGYLSSNDARGAMNLSHCPDPHAWERLNYVRILRGWRPR
ncbi:MAG: dihydroorotate dehydrogenase-like protein [Myxococcota bacterium]